MTVAQVRVALAELLRSPPASPAAIAAAITRQIRRNEAARRDRWRAKGLVAPPKRGTA
jgi:hypothetical protein